MIHVRVEAVVHFVAPNGDELIASDAFGKEFFEEIREPLNALADAAYKAAVTVAPKHPGCFMPLPTYILAREVQRGK